MPENNPWAINWQGLNIPYPQPAGAWGGGGLQGVQELVPQEHVKEDDMPYAQIKKKATKVDRSASQWSDEYQVLAKQLTKLEESLRREMGELASAVEGTSRLIEVVRDIGSLTQEHLTTLLRVAIQLETMRVTGHRLVSPGSEPAQAGEHQHPPVAVPIDEVEEGQFVPQPWQQDQG